MKPIPKDNLTKSGRKVMKNLHQRDDIIITKADKEGAVVIMEVEDYIKEANKKVSDTNNYQKLNIGPTTIHIKKLNLLSTTINMLNKYHQKWQTCFFLTR